MTPLSSLNFDDPIFILKVWWPLLLLNVDDSIVFLEFWWATFILKFCRPISSLNCDVPSFMHKFYWLHCYASILMTWSLELWWPICILEFWWPHFHPYILLTSFLSLSFDDPTFILKFCWCILSLNFSYLIFILAFFWPHFHPYIISNPIFMLEFWWARIHPRILMTPLSCFNFDDPTLILEFWWYHFVLEFRWPNVVFDEYTLAIKFVWLKFHPWILMFPLSSLNFINPCSSFLFHESPSFLNF